MSTKSLTLNPFTHAKNGFKKLYKTNFWEIVASYAMLLVGILVVSAVIAVIFLNKINNADSINDLSDVGFGPIIATALIVILAFIVGSIFSLFINRLILAGVNGKREELKTALKLAVGRVKLYITLGLFAIALISIATLLLVLLPPIGVLAIIALIIAAILYLPALVVLSYVIVDDNKPVNVKQLLKRSVEKSKPVTNQLWIVILVALGFSILVDGIFGGSPSNVSANAIVYGNDSLIGNLFSMIIGIFFTVATAEIYLHSKKDN